LLVEKFQVTFGSIRFEKRPNELEPIYNKNRTNILGYVVVLTNDTLSTSGTMNTIVIKALNSYFFRTFSTFVHVFSSISDLFILNKIDSVKKNDMNFFQIQFTRLGEPSCCLIEMIDSNSVVHESFTIGTSEEFCKLYYSAISFKEKYKIAENNRFEFSTQMTKLGMIKMQLTARNRISNEIQSTNVAVTETNSCLRPYSIILNQASLFYQPRVVKRSDLLNVVVETVLDCNDSLNNQKIWRVYAANSQNGVKLNKINIDSNPTIYNSELVIKQNSLDYGLYLIVNQVDMKWNKQLMTSENYTYVKIVPSGIVLKGLEGGLNEIRIGTVQGLEINPVKYSHDLDFVISVSKLNYEFYCQVIESNVEQGYPSLTSNSFLNLDQLKKLNFNRVRLSMNSSKTCFDSISNSIAFRYF
jgi:hypothetical protein